MCLLTVAQHSHANIRSTVHRSPHNYDGMMRCNTLYPWLMWHVHSVKIIYTICSWGLLYIPCDHKKKCLRFESKNVWVQVRVRMCASECKGVIRKRDDMTVFFFSFFLRRCERLDLSSCWIAPLFWLSSPHITSGKIVVYVAPRSLGVFVPVVDNCG